MMTSKAQLQPVERRRPERRQLKRNGKLSFANRRRSVNELARKLLDEGSRELADGVVMVSGDRS